MLSFGTKINLILFLISVLVALYLFVMQKEVRLMQNDISEIRTLVDKLMKSKFSAEKPPCKAEDEACIIEPLVIFDDDDDDDNESDDDTSEDASVTAPAPASSPVAIVTDSAQEGGKSKKAPKNDISAADVIEVKVPEIDGDVETILKTIDTDEHTVKLSSTKTTKKRKAPAASKN